MNNERRTQSRVAIGLLGLTALVAPTIANAQPRWGRPSMPQSGACFYRDADFRGDYFCAGIGEDIGYLTGGMDNQISSIRVFGRAEVTMYEGARYSGRAIQIEGDVRNLRFGGWNDRLSSIRVTADYPRGRDDWGRGRDNDNRGGIGRDDRNGRDDRYGRDDRNGRDDRYGRDDRNDRNGQRVSEIDATVRRIYLDVLKREADAAGLTLYRNHMMNDNWSEADVREALTRSAEYRDRFTMTPQKAQDVVARAYRAVLNREPDPASQGYVNRVLREGWTQADVERELRNSAEYRLKNRR